MPLCDVLFQERTVFMDASELLKALHVAERLKDATRHCYTSGGRHESVAEHSWRISLMAYWVSDEFPEADMNKVIRMCLIHDLGEAFTGDIPTFLKTASDEKREDDLLADWVSGLPEPFRKEMADLYQEQADESTKRLTEAMTPAMTIIVAGMVGIVAVAIVMPMFGMYGVVADSAHN